MNIEMKKTRLDYMWKMCVLCPPVVGTLIVYFYQKTVNFPDVGEIVLLGFMAFTTLFFISACWYIYNELFMLQDEKHFMSLEKTTITNEAFKCVFNALKFGGGYLLIHTIILVIKYMYRLEWIKILTPNTSSLTVMASMSAISFFVPKNRQIRMCCIPLHTEIDGCPFQLANIKNKKLFVVYTNTIKNIGWTTLGMFLFNWFYLIWFV